MTGRQELYRRDDTRALLRDLLNLGDAKITPKISVNTEYTPKNAQIDRLGFDEATALLNLLSEGAVLRRWFHDKVVRCPRCNDFAVKPRFICPRCGSHDLVKGEAVEHLRCGHVGLEEAFRSGEDLVCPKCRKEMKQIGVDYKRAGAWFKCRGCAEFFGEPAFRFSCEGCQSLFRLSEAVFKDVYVYEVNADVRAEVQANISYPDLVFTRLGRESGEIRRLTEIKGRSGVTLAFDLLLEKDGRLAAVEFVFEEASVDKILAVYAKSIEVDLYRVAVVAMAGVSKEVGLLAETYGITLIQSNDPDVVATGIDTLLSGS